VCDWLPLVDAACRGTENGKGCVFICEVDLCEDSQIRHIPNGYETDAYILKNPVPIGDFLYKHNLCLETVQKCGLMLKYIKGLHQTPLLCYAAVHNDGMALRFVKNENKNKNKLYTISREAVLQNGLALRFVGEQTPEICMIAVTQNGLALQFVKQQTEALTLAAVLQNDYALLHVKEEVKSYKLFMQVALKCITV
jgi:hypothetical protein